MRFSDYSRDKRWVDRQVTEMHPPDAPPSVSIWGASNFVGDGVARKIKKREKERHPLLQADVDEHRSSICSWRAETFFSLFFFRFTLSSRSPSPAVCSHGSRC